MKNGERVMYKVKGKKRKVNIFSVVNGIKKDIKQQFPELEIETIMGMLSRIRKYHIQNLTHNKGKKPRGRRSTKLTPLEMVFYDYLLKKGLNPSTTYLWFLACRVPEDVKNKVERGDLSCKEAIKIYNNRKRNKISNQGVMLIEEINEIIRGL